MKEKEQIVLNVVVFVVGVLIGYFGRRLPNSPDQGDEVVLYEDGMELEEGKIYQF